MALALRPASIAQDGTHSMEMKLVWPSQEYLPSYVAALERGWSPDNLRGQAAVREELDRIAPTQRLPSFAD